VYDKRRWREAVEAEIATKLCNMHKRQRERLSPSELAPTSVSTTSTIKATTTQEASTAAKVAPEPGIQGKESTSIHSQQAGFRRNSDQVSATDTTNSVNAELKAPPSSAKPNLDIETMVHEVHIVPVARRKEASTPEPSLASTNQRSLAVTERAAVPQPTVQAVLHNKSPSPSSEPSLASSDQGHNDAIERTAAPQPAVVLQREPATPESPHAAFNLSRNVALDRNMAPQPTILFPDAATKKREKLKVQSFDRKATVTTGPARWAEMVDAAVHQCKQVQTECFASGDLALMSTYDRYNNRIALLQQLQCGVAMDKCSTSIPSCSGWLKKKMKTCDEKMQELIAVIMADDSEGSGDE
jgi:hypothetical protein